MCGKYSRWLRVPGPLYIGPFLTQLPILFAYIDIYGFWGARYKRGYNFSYLDCYTPKLCGKYPRWLKVPGPLDIGPFLTQLPILFTYIDIYGFWGPVKEESLILVISIVTLQNCFGDLGEMCGKHPRWLKVPGPLDIGPSLTQLPILFAYIDIYGFWVPVIKEGLI